MIKKQLEYLKGERISLGNLHPIKKIIWDICEIFLPFGYKIMETNEIEEEKYNFEKLNIDKDHPARNDSDTFYLSKKFLLRTHTSSSEIRIMEKKKNKELKFIFFGKVYRRDEDDSTHTHQFTQLELFSIGKKNNILELRKMIKILMKKIFGDYYPFRYRSSYFPFTEPSFEIDLKCIKCNNNEKEKCSLCKGSGWIEILGGGLIRENIIKRCGFDDNKFTSFAFGLGIERLLMIKYKIDNIRSFYLNDLRFLKQFKEI